MFSGENLQYSECISFIEEAEGNNMFEIEADKEHIQHLKDFLQDFIKWLNEVRECLNKNKKNQLPADVNVLINTLGFYSIDDGR